MTTPIRRASPEQPTPRWAGLEDGGAYAAVHRKTLRRWISQGRLKAYYAGPRLIRVDLNELDAMIRNGGGGSR